MTWSRRQCCHLCSPPRVVATSLDISHILSSDNTRKLMMVQTMSKSFTGRWSQACVELPPSSGDSWFQNNLSSQRALPPERFWLEGRNYSLSAGSQPTPLTAMDWHLWFVTVSFAIQVTCPRYFMKHKITRLGGFALLCYQKTPAQP